MKILRSDATRPRAVARRSVPFFAISGWLLATALIAVVGISLKGEKWDSAFLFPISVFAIYILWAFYVAIRVRHLSCTSAPKWFLIGLSPLFFGTLTSLGALLVTRRPVPITFCVVELVFIVLCGYAVLQEIRSDRPMETRSK